MLSRSNTGGNGPLAAIRTNQDNAIFGADRKTMNVLLVIH